MSPSARPLARVARRLAPHAAAWALAAAALAGGAHAQPARLPDTLAQRVAACTPCHGDQGRAARDGYYPRIAGKPAGYLFNQLVNFREGRRHYGPMVALVDPLNDAYVHEIAAHFAAIEAPYPPPVPAREPAAMLERGRRLATTGDASKRLPACAACHGAQLTGMLPATPGLLGLPRDYLTGQLGAWLTGQRRAHAPDCMGEITQRLAREDIAAVAAWLSSQPVPGAGKPAPTPDAALPMKCSAEAPTAAGATR